MSIQFKFQLFKASESKMVTQKTFLIVVTPNFNEGMKQL